MAHSAQARKRARQAAKANLHNSALRSKFRTAIKAVRKAIGAGDQVKAAELYKAATKTVDTIADKKIVHKNKAARHKSRLSAAIKSLQAAENRIGETGGRAERDAAAPVFLDTN
ncbi:MAG: 30S ribosomal protein S20 [Burkholderia gladioli]|nr:MAG: 30S ribosomal protein S20 [Burkholderia gladioli]